MGHRRTETGARNLLLGVGGREERRILIVDDDRDSTHLLKILLEKTGGYLMLEENDAARLIRVPTISGRT